MSSILSTTEDRKQLLSKADKHIKYFLALSSTVVSVIGIFTTILIGIAVVIIVTPLSALGWVMLFVVGGLAILILGLWFGGWALGGVISGFIYIYKYFDLMDHESTENWLWGLVISFLISWGVFL